MLSLVQPSCDYMQNFTETFRLNHREKCCGANQVSPRVNDKRLTFPLFIRVDYDFTKVTNAALFGCNPWVFKYLSVFSTRDPLSKLHPFSAPDSVRVRILSCTDASVSFLATLGDHFSAHQNEGDGYPVLLFLRLLLLRPPSPPFSPFTLLSDRRRRVPTSVRHAPLGGNNQRSSRIQDSARRPSAAAELAGVPAVSQSESDPDAPLFARREMNEDAQWSQWTPPLPKIGVYFIS